MGGGGGGLCKQPDVGQLMPSADRAITVRELIQSLLWLSASMELSLSCSSSDGKHVADNSKAYASDCVQRKKTDRLQFIHVIAHKTMYCGIISLSVLK